MGELKATPGPWLVATSNSWRRIESARGESVCQPVTQRDRHPDLHFPNGGEDGPDARLMAAAPELYEALQALLEDLRERAKHKVEDGEATEVVLACGNGVLFKAEAALAKVRGEGDDKG